MLYQTNAAKESMKVQLRTGAVGFPSVRALNVTFQRYFNMTIPAYRQATRAPADGRAKMQYPHYLDRQDPEVGPILQRYLAAFTSP